MHFARNIICSKDNIFTIKHDLNVHDKSVPFLCICHPRSLGVNFETRMTETIKQAALTNPSEGFGPSRQRAQNSQNPRRGWLKRPGRPKTLVLTESRPKRTFLTMFWTVLMAVNFSIKISVPCCETQNPDLDDLRRVAVSLSRRVSLKPQTSSEGLVKENQKNRHRRVSLNILAIFALTGPSEVNFCIIFL